MQTVKSPKIIYFLADSAPTPEEAIDMLKYGNNVQVRNSRYISENDGREECDGVAGSIPQIYASAPTGEEAIAEYGKKIRERMERVGDNQAPQAAEVHAVRLMGAKTAPGPDDIKEVPEKPVIVPDAVTNHPDTTAPAEAKPSGPTTTAKVKATPAAAPGWKAGQ